MDLLTDEEMLHGIALGDEEYLALLYDRYGRAAYSLASRILGDIHAAEDVVQEAFLNVWRMARSFDETRGSARSWLLSVVHHRAIDVVRKNRGKPPITAPDEYRLPATDLEDVWHRVANNLSRESILQAMAQLPEKQREAIELAFFSGYTHREVSEQQAVPLGTAKGRIRNGMDKLRSILLSQEAEVQ